MQNNPISAPIFIIGASRSGTTLLSNLLDAHSRVAIPYESHFFVDYERRYGDRLLSPSERIAVLRKILGEPYVRRWDWTPSPDAIELSDCGTLAAIIRAIYTTYAKHFGKTIWGDKSPSYIEHVDTLYRLFPDARFIHVIRDGRDVALSVTKQWWGPNDFFNAVAWWTTQVGVARAALTRLPANQVLELKLEDIANQLEPVLQQVLDFLRLDYEPEILIEHRARAATRVGHRIRYHHAGLTEQITIDRVTRWPSELCGGDQALAWQIAGELLSDLGYPTGISNHPLARWRKLVHRVLESWHWRTGTQQRRYDAVLGMRQLSD